MKNLITIILLFISWSTVMAYPYDGYWTTGIDRLLRIHKIKIGELRGSFGPKGEHLNLYQIKLNLIADSLIRELPPMDDALAEQLKNILPNQSDRYSVAIMDITEGRPIRYAAHKENLGYQPGSVGKLAILTGLFCELQNIYPESFEKRQKLLRSKHVSARDWAMSDHHTVPFFDPATNKYFKRTVIESDVFSLYEWTDHMVSVSNNGAASVLWREVVLMRAFGEDYPSLSDEDAEAFFKAADRKLVSSMAMEVVNQPLRDLGITEDEWRLGSLFTYGGKRRIYGTGGSQGTPVGLMKWMMHLEQGNIVDHKSSLEIKRMMYVTDRRIRYAATNELDEAAVYFKSGSFYKCDRSRDPSCGKYEGNVYNYMNSIAIVEQPGGATYMVALMTNVLGKNSNWDHRRLAKDIDHLLSSY